MSGTDLLEHQALQAPGEDGNEGDHDKGDEMLLRPLNDRVQPAVIRNPGEGAFHHPADAGRNEDAIMAASDRLDGYAERLPGLCQPFAPVTEIAQRRSPEAL